MMWQTRYSWLAVVVLASCSMPKREAVEPEADTLEETTVSKPSIEELTLPDTIFESAAAIRYVVESADSLPALLSDYDDPYDSDSQVLTFRKNLMRNADFGGRVAGTPQEIAVAWCFSTPDEEEETEFGKWGGGTGWTGQPLYVRWSADDIDSLRRGGAPLTADFGPEEIMVGSLCGQAFFLNYHTGRPSRSPLDLHNVVKGTMSKDPDMLNLYVGQGVSKGEPLGCQAFDLLTHERNFFFADKKSWRRWQAFDSSPVVVGGWLFWPGENGSLYKFRRLPGGRLVLCDVLRYRIGGAAPGIESSLCVYRNYGFFCDNHGHVLCVNLNTMKPVWHFKNLDDSDATIVCREEGGIPYLYTACEVDRQGDEGVCRFVKLRALDGRQVWECKIPCTRIQLATKSLDGGMYSTPLPGQGDCEQLIFANVCRNNAAQGRGQLTAIDTATGSIVYTVAYSNFCWSSPVGFLNEQNEMFILTADAYGVVYLIRGRDGKVLCTKELGDNVESSPCVVGNTAVVGCRGTKIYKFVIK